VNPQGRGPLQSQKTKKKLIKDRFSGPPQGKGGSGERTLRARKGAEHTPAIRYQLFSKKIGPDLNSQEDAGDL